MKCFFKSKHIKYKLTQSMRQYLPCGAQFWNFLVKSLESYIFNTDIIMKMLRLEVKKKWTPRKAR